MLMKSFLANTSNFLYNICVVQGLPESNRMRLLINCLHSHATPSAFLIWNHLCDLVCQPPVKTGVIIW